MSIRLLSGEPVRFLLSDMGLFLLSDTFEGIAIRFLVNEPAGVCISLSPGFCFGVVYLTSVFNHSVPVAIASWWVCRHLLPPVDAGYMRG